MIATASSDPSDEYFKCVQKQLGFDIWSVGPQQLYARDDVIDDIAFGKKGA